MSYIEIVDKDKAKGKLKNLYQRIEKRSQSGVANILKVHSINPDALEAHLNLYETLMFGESKLTRMQREMIAVVSSVSNQCDYWTKHHEEALRYASEEDKIMLMYVEKLTKESYRITKNDIEKLRKAKFSDREIFDINQITAYFNYVNRIAHGLGVEIE